MSRIGKKPVVVPTGVKVAISDRIVTVEGPKGKLTFEHRPEVSVEWSEDQKTILVNAKDSAEDKRLAKALWGTTRAVINNMVEGTSKGFERKLEVVGVGWGSEVSGQTIKLTLGFANIIEVAIPTGVEVLVEKQIITIKSADKHAVGQLAAIIRSKRPPEPYNGKGVKYLNEIIQRKQGKQFGA